MPSFNSITVMGHAGQEPEMRFTPSGTAVTGFSVAVNHNYQKDGEWVQETYWFRVDCWGKLAESVNQKVLKGDLVLVQGELQIRKYTTQNGEEKTVVAIRAARVIPLSPKRQDEAGRPAAPQPEEEDLAF